MLKLYVDSFFSKYRDEPGQKRERERERGGGEGGERK